MNMMKMVRTTQISQISMVMIEIKWLPVHKYEQASFIFNYGFNYVQMRLDAI